MKLCYENILECVEKDNRGKEGNRQVIRYKKRE